MTDEEIRRRFHELEDENRQCELDRGLIQKDIEYMKAETAKIQKAVDENAKLLQAAVTDIRILMVKFGIVITVVMTGIGLGFKVWECFHK